MSFKHIVVQAAGKAEDARRVAMAVDLANRCEATLGGVFLEPAPPWLFVGGDLAAPAALADLTESHRKAVQTASAAARANLEAAAQGKSFEWRQVDGSAPTALAEVAREADLLFMAGPPLTSRDGVFAPADAVALTAGAPIIAVPETATGTCVGHRVLVAWNGARESARALRDALPLLQRAAQVDGVIVDHPEAARDGERVLKAFLQRHGCPAINVIRLPAGGRHASEVILQHAAHVVQADLIVMGLYGHSRLREFVLGGVSRDMLDDSPIPLLLSH